MKWHESGTEPDYRFSLANERTFLAWIRTALAILAGSLVLHQSTAEFRFLRLTISIGAWLPVVSAALALVAYVRWKANEIAMRHGQPLPRSCFLAVFAVATAIVAIAAGGSMFLR